MLSLLQMWKSPGAARSALVALVVSPLLAAMPIAAANAGPDEFEPVPMLTDPEHRSHMVVPAGGPFPIREKITIGVDKSMLIELPVEMKNVLVSNPEVLDAVVQTPTQIYLLAKDMGEANAFFVGPGGEKILFLEVSVTRDLTALHDTFRRLIPGSKINAEMMGDSVVLSGNVVSAVDANRATELAARFVKKEDGVVNLLATDANEQVLLKVQVAEIQRDALRRIGVDIPGAVLRNGNFTFAKVVQNSFPVTSSVVPEAVAGAILPGVNAGTALQPSWQTGNNNVTALVEALERSGVLRTLAEPTLTAISGETAKFLAGGEFPIPIAEEDNKVTVEWKPFVVNVSFKPVVLDEGRISLTISAEVSEISTEGAIQLATLSLPGLRVRRAETTLELPSGGTLAMAGLLSDETRTSVEGIPGLKDLPVLGALFRSNDYRRRETELVILVTPYLATHQSRNVLERPDDGYAPTSELKELFFGRINRVYGIGAESGRYRGDYGFIIDYPGVKG